MRKLAGGLTLILALGGTSRTEEGMGPIGIAPANPQVGATAEMPSPRVEFPGAPPRTWNIDLFPETRPPKVNPSAERILLSAAALAIREWPDPAALGLEERVLWRIDRKPSSWWASSPYLMDDESARDLYRRMMSSPILLGHERPAWWGPVSMAVPLRRGLD